VNGGPFHASIFRPNFSRNFPRGPLVLDHGDRQGRRHIDPDPAHTGREVCDTVDRPRCLSRPAGAVDEHVASNREHGLVGCPKQRVRRRLRHLHELGEGREAERARGLRGPRDRLRNGLGRCPGCAAVAMHLEAKHKLIREPQIRPGGRLADSAKRL
jgi:hypothetical protein